MATQIKIFTSSNAIQKGGLEAHVNQWLRANPSIAIQDIQTAMGGTEITVYMVMVRYDDGASERKDQPAA